MKMKNSTHIEGLLYQHNLTKKESGTNSKNPGTVFINGTIDIATDNALTNIIQVHFTYVTALTAKGTANATFVVLNDIIDGRLATVMSAGADNAAKLRVDSAIGLNDFYSSRNGTEELVSVKRNEGGFVHTTPTLVEDEKARNTFDCDMVINNVKVKEADEERNLPEQVVVSGVIFDFRESILPVSFTSTDSRAINYFVGLDASEKNPVFTHIRGVQKSAIVNNTVSEDGAFGEAYVRNFSNTRKDWEITWAASEPYEWDSEDTITAAAMKQKVADRETYLATVKQRQDEYNASRAAGANAIASAPATAPQINKGEFKF